MYGLSDSVWSVKIFTSGSPIIFGTRSSVKKKDNTLCMCVDYRHLNSVSQMDTYLNAQG